MVVAVAGEALGYDPEEMHEAFKMLFLLRHEQGKPDTVKSTTSLGVAEFSDYVERCARWCAQEGIVIPEAKADPLDDPNWTPEIDQNQVDKG